MPGKHRTDRHSNPTAARFKLLGPVVTAAVVTAVFAGGAYAVTQVSDGTLAQDGPSDTPTSASPTASASASPIPPAPTPEAARPPDQVSRAGTRPTATASGTVVSTGTCGASFYDEPQGTANGETFDPESLTAAHKTLKFNTRVRVTNVDNGKSVVVRINDRGPYIDGRCLDLSRAAFREIEDLDAGHATVRYEVLG